MGRLSSTAEHCTPLKLYFVRSPKKNWWGGGVIDKEHQNEENDILCCRWQHPCEQAAGGDKAPGDAISPRRGRGGEGVQRGEGVTSGGRGEL